MKSRADCDCDQCRRSQQFRAWLDGDPGPWATILMFTLCGLVILAAVLAHA